MTSYKIYLPPVLSFDKGQVNSNGTSFRIIPRPHSLDTQSYPPSGDTLNHVRHAANSVVAYTSSISTNFSVLGKRKALNDDWEVLGDSHRKVDGVDSRDRNSAVGVPDQKIGEEGTSRRRSSRLSHSGKPPHFRSIHLPSPTLLYN